MTQPDDDDMDTVDDEFEAPRRRAGLRPDELAPGKTNHDPADCDTHAAGTPGGGSAAGGLAGTNAGDGAAENADLEEALGSGRDDNSGDTVADDEPQSGRSGGAVGGTPANKRVRPH